MKEPLACVLVLRESCRESRMRPNDVESSEWPRVQSVVVISHKNHLRKRLTRREPRAAAAQGSIHHSRVMIAGAHTEKSGKSINHREKWPALVGASKHNTMSAIDNFCKGDNFCSNYCQERNTNQLATTESVTSSVSARRTMVTLFGVGHETVLRTGQQAGARARTRKRTSTSAHPNKWALIGTGARARLICLRVCNAHTHTSRSAQRLDSSACSD